MKKLAFLTLLLLASISQAQQIQSPSEFLGYELGTKFTRHHRVMDYCQYLAGAAADMVKMTEYGRTYEDRPLTLLYLSSSENMSSLEDIRKQHLESSKGNTGSGKAVVWMSYNVHGNESVSTEAAMQTLYELLTTKKEYLDNTVVIIDPCVNPDGRDRYVNWYNQVKNIPHQVEPESREHHEGWHSGRTNHYMFDLNRDWAWLTQKESQQRLKVYNQWQPHIHVDFHEQNVDAPYFFAPAAEPFHEVITGFQRDFQTEIGKNHARYFDEQGWLYFTKERFDLFYPSYGDTYPTYNGAIGMTYEQGGGGRAGLGVLTKSGDTLTLKDRIDHHLTTGLSTVEVGSRNAERLNKEFSKFHNPKNYRYKSYVMKGGEDQIGKLVNWLDSHGIEYGQGKGNSIKGYRYSSARTESFRSDENSLVIHTDQAKGTLVKVLFEPNAKLSDSLTYDITAWSLPYAYGLDAVASENKVASDPYQLKKTENTWDNDKPYAYISDWNSMDDARFLTAALSQGIRVRAAQIPFKLEGVSYPRGSLIVTRTDNRNLEGFDQKIRKLANKQGKILIAAKTGFVEEGKDLGSSEVKFITAPRIAMLNGEPTSTSSYGEIWHFFEQQLGYPFTSISTDRLENSDLSNYDVIILPGGYSYTSYLNNDIAAKLNTWVKNGGSLIAMDGAIKGLAGKEGFGIKERELSADLAKNENSVYEVSARERAKEDVKGAIFTTRVDNTHPLAFGYSDQYYTLKMRNGSYDFLQKGNVAVIGENTKPLAGFSGSETSEKLINSLVFGAEEMGSGHVIYMVDNPLFRGFWENGKLFFANALFMAR